MMSKTSWIQDLSTLYSIQYIYIRGALNYWPLSRVIILKNHPPPTPKNHSMQFKSGRMSRKCSLLIIGYKESNLQAVDNKCVCVECSTGLKQRSLHCCKNG